MKGQGQAPQRVERRVLRVVPGGGDEEDRVAWRAPQRERHGAERCLIGGVDVVDHERDRAAARLQRGEMLQQHRARGEGVDRRRPEPQLARQEVVEHRECDVALLVRRRREADDVGPHRREAPQQHALADPCRSREEGDAGRSAGGSLQHGRELCELVHPCDECLSVLVILASPYAL